MAQKRTFEFESDDSTFEINQRLLEIVRPGLYHGFDPVLGAGLTLSLDQNTTGKTVVDENELVTSKTGVYITKQGVIIREDAAINIPVDVGGSQPRIDLVVSEHLYTNVSGGQPAIYLIIKGTPSANPVKPILTNPNRQLILGEINIPANMSSLQDAEYIRPDQPDFADNGFLQRIEDIEEVLLDLGGGVGASLKAASNLSDVASKSASRANLDLGNHVTYNFSTTGGNNGSANVVARSNHAHGSVYEPVFNKYTAFNKNFGSSSGSVCQGNDSRLSNSRKCNNTFDNSTTSRSNLGLGNHVTTNFSGSGGDHGSASNVARGDHAHPASDITSGTLVSARIPNLSYSKITSGYISLYGRLRTKGQRISYDGEYDGIYIRSDNNISIGDHAGSESYKLRVKGSSLIRNHDMSDNETATATQIWGRGQYGSFPMTFSVKSSPTGTYTKAVGLNVQMSTHNDVAGKHEWIRFMDVYGGVAGYIGNSTLLPSGPAIEIWGLNDTHSPSDERLKDNVKNTGAVLKDLDKIKIVDFNYKGNDEKRTGIIAQQLLKVLPSYVDDPTERNELKGLEEDTNSNINNYEYMSIKYQRFIPVLIKAVQDLNKEVKLLKSKTK